MEGGSIGLVVYGLMLDRTLGRVECCVGENGWVCLVRWREEGMGVPSEDKVGGGIYLVGGEMVVGEWVD